MLGGGRVLQGGETLPNHRPKCWERDKGWAANGREQLGPARGWELGSRCWGSTDAPLCWALGGVTEQGLLDTLATPSRVSP